MTDEPTDAELVDLYWRTNGDDWAIPDEVMVKFGHAVWDEAGRRAAPATVTPSREETVREVLGFIESVTPSELGYAPERWAVRGVLDQARAKFALAAPPASTEDKP